MKNWKLKFFTIWTGQAFSLLGSSLVDFALIWWLTDFTGSERVLVISSLLTLLPRMVLGPFAGSLIDRTNRKTVMVIADTAIAVFTVGLVVMFTLGIESTAIILITLLLRSLGSMFHQPAMKSATALLVPEEHLARIGGLNRVLSGAMTIAAPVAGAMLIEAFEVVSVLYIDIVTALIAVVTLLCSSVPNVKQAEDEAEKTSFMRETADGLKYVLKTRSIFFVVGTCTLANFCFGPTEALKSLLVTSVFGGGVMELSAVTVSVGLGMLAGGALMGIWGGFKRNLLTAGAGWGGVGVAYILIALIPETWFIGLVVLMFFGSLALAVGCAALDAFYQTKVPSELHGRVFSVLATLDATTIPIGLAVAAILGDAVPIQIWYLLTGILHVALFVFWSFSKELKRAEM